MAARVRFAVVLEWGPFGPPFNYAILSEGESFAPLRHPGSTGVSRTSYN